MKKFDKIINEFMSQNASITPNIVSAARRDMRSTPTSVKDTLNVVSDIVDPDNADPFQRKLSDIINPDSQTSFNDLSPEEQKMAIEILGKAGIPIGALENSEEKQKTQSNNQNPTSISSSTNYSA
jgi:hypothetical protein